jgi:hypothetical protein
MTFKALMAAAVFSAVVVIPFLPSARLQPEHFVFEVAVASSAAGHLQIYYDGGAGFREEASARVELKPSSRPETYRLPLPAGTYRAIRFDPNDRESRLTVAHARITDTGGHVIRAFAPGTFAPLNQIDSLQVVSDELRLTTTPGGHDPQLLLRFAPPLVVQTSWHTLAGGFATRFFVVFAGLVLGMLALERWPGLQVAAGRWAGWLSARPGRAVALVALAAALISAYPVAFLGKSFVSPNFGTALLYAAFPTLPGYADTGAVDAKAADVGPIMWQHVPLSMIQRRALAHDGELPLWNRYNSCGTALLGQGQSMFGDPLHFFVVAANGAAWAWDVKFLFAKWLFAVGLGLLVLAVTRHLPAALVAAAAAPFVGFFVYRVNHPAIFSVCYAPWALFCLVRAAQAASVADTARWGAGLLLANWALMNSGTAKEAYMLLVCMNLSGLCVLLAAAAQWRVRLAKLAGLAFAGLVFMLVSAPVWLTFLNSLQAAYTSYNTPNAYQLQPSLLLGAFDEVFYRPLVTEERVLNPSANFIVLLGLLYYFATLRHHLANRAATALALASLLPLSLAFGLVPAAWIVRVPFLGNVVHIDNTFSCALIILWSVLAGVGYQAGAERLGTREGRADLVQTGLLLFALVFAYVAFRQTVHKQLFGPDTTFSVIKTGTEIPVSRFIWGYLASLLLAAVGLGLTLRRVLVRRALTPATALVLTVCVAALLWRLGFHAGSVGFDGYVLHPPTRVDFHAPSSAVEYLQAAQRTTPSRSFGLRWNFFLGWTGTYGLESVGGPDALVNPFYREIIHHSGLDLRLDWLLYLEPKDVAAVQWFLDFLNVRHYLDRSGEPVPTGTVRKLALAADLAIYESPTAWPRAFFTDRVAVYGDAREFAQLVKDSAGRPLAAVQRGDQLPAGLPPADLAGRTVVPAAGYRLTNNTTAFTVTVPGPGVVVLTEAWLKKDFRVTVDGRPAAYFRVNHAFKGVLVDRAGTHRIEFRYWPRDFTLALSLMATGLVLAAGAAVYALRSRVPSA